MDIDSVPLGIDFVEHVTEQIGKCNAVIVMIGKQWQRIKDKKRRRRLDNEDDLVRAEIRAALQQKIPVIPVTVQNATMPQLDDLPDDIRLLARRNGIDLSATRWTTDVERLIKELDRVMKPSTALRDRLPGVEGYTLPKGPQNVTLSRARSRSRSFFTRSKSRLATASGSHTFAVPRVPLGSGPSGRYQLAERARSASARESTALEGHSLVEPPRNRNFRRKRAPKVGSSIAALVPAGRRPALLTTIVRKRTPAASKEVVDRGRLLWRRHHHQVRPHLEPRTPNRALVVAALALQREHRRRLRVLGCVLDVIDADRFIWSRPGDEGPIGLLHHQRGPTVVVASLPDDEVKTFGLSHGRHRQERSANASSAGVAISMWEASAWQTHVARQGSFASTPA